VPALTPKGNNKKGKAKDSDEEISEGEGFDENGKPIFKDETFKVKPDVIIAKNEKNKKTLKELEKVSRVLYLTEYRYMGKTLMSKKQG
jgi:ABC-type Fe3+-citrate transport system substrate-binding protein